MKARRGDVRALATIIGVLVAIGCIAIAVFFVHGTVRRDNLTERNYRALAMASEQVRERMDGWRVAIGTAARGSSDTKAAFFCAQSVPDTQVGGDLRTMTATSSAIVTSPARRDGTRMAIEPDSEHRSIEAYVAYDASCDENPRRRGPPTRRSRTRPPRRRARMQTRRNRTCRRHRRTATSARPARRRPASPSACRRSSPASVPTRRCSTPSS